MDNQANVLPWERKVWRGHGVPPSQEAKDEAIIFYPLLHTGQGFRFIVGLLGIVLAWGAYAYITQYVLGLGVTGMNRPVYWGVYITNFFFFIG